MAGGIERGDVAAHGVADQVQPGEAQCLGEGMHALGLAGDVIVDIRFAAFAESRQIQRDHPVILEVAGET